VYEMRANGWQCGNRSFSSRRSAGRRHSGVDAISRERLRGTRCMAWKAEDEGDGYHIHHGDGNTAARFIWQLRMWKEDDCTYVRILYHTHSMAGVLHGFDGILGILSKSNVRTLEGGYAIRFMCFLHTSTS
jgi:hypothetical protein